MSDHTNEFNENSKQKNQSERKRMIRNLNDDMLLEAIKFLELEDLSMK